MRKLPSPPPSIWLDAIARALPLLLTGGVLMSPVPLAQAQGPRLTQAYVQEIVSEARRTYGVPAIALTVMDSSGIRYREVQGVRVLGRQDNATFDDYFHIGSCSKSVLAVIAASLVEQKKIQWDTRFLEVFPELKAVADKAYAEITLEDLLLCRAGIKPYTLLAVDPLPRYGPEVADKRLAFVKHLIGQPPASEMEDGKFPHLYSNASYTMASAMLERVAGKTYEALVQATLREGMGLPVHIGWPNRIGPNQPWGHMLAEGKVEPFGPEHEYEVPELLTPAGDLSMTANGYAEYTRQHLNGLRGNDNVISGAAYRHIHFARDGFSLGASNGDMLGRRYSGFDGSTGTFYSRSIIVPDADFAFTIMTNAGSPNGSMEAVEWLSRKIVEKEFDLSWWRKLWLWLWW